MAKNKLTKTEETLKVIQEKIGGCFGDEDKIFCSHALDKKRARDLRSLALKNNLSLADVLDAAENWLKSQHCPPERIATELRNAREFFGTPYFNKKLT